MVAGILGFKDSDSGPKVVYTVPTGKIAVVNIFGFNGGIFIGGVVGMSSTETLIGQTSSGNSNIILKGIVLQAGAYVKFDLNTTGIVTGFEEDA